MTAREAQEVSLQHAIELTVNLQHKLKVMLRNNRVEGVEPTWAEAGDAQKVSHDLREVAKFIGSYY